MVDLLKKLSASIERNFQSYRQDDYFGYAVSVYEDTAIIGAEWQDYDVGGGNLLADAGAAYVFTRNTGIWTLQQKLVGYGTNGRIAGDYFGNSVSVYSDTAVVGAYLQDYDAAGSTSLTSAGAAYVFTRNTGVWTFQQKLVGSGTNGRIATDNFGYSVSVYGDTIAVGSHLQDYDAAGSVAATNAGATYVFTRNTGVWTLQQKLVGSGTNGRIATDQFGFSVSVYNDTAVVGANLQDYDAAGSVAATNAGAAYVFTRNTGVWTLQQKLVGSGTNGRIASDYFGVSVSVYSDTAVVGAYLQDFDATGSTSLTDAGAAYVFTRNTGVWTLEQKLVGSGTNGRIAGDRFSGSVSVYDNTIAVGSYLQDYSAAGSVQAIDAGAAYVFTRNTGVWTLEQKLVGSGTNGRFTSDWFGYSVSVHNNTTFAGSHLQAYDSAGANSFANAGAAYVFTRNTGVWTLEQKLVGSGTNGRVISDRFGYSVAAYGDKAVIGAYFQDFDASGSTSLDSAGAAYVFKKIKNNYILEQKLVGSGTNGRMGSDQFGISVAIYEDTIIVGANLQDFDEAGSNSQASSGAAYVFTRNTGVWTLQQKLVGSGTNGRVISDYFGYDVSVYSDTAIVGAYFQDYDAAGSVAATNTGAAYVFTRNTGVWTLEQKLVGSGTNGRIASDWFGYSVSVYSDTAVVGAYQQDYNAAGSVASTNAGAAYVFTRNTGVWTLEQKLVGSGTNGRIATDYFGYDVSVYGDTITVGSNFQDYDAAGSVAVTNAGAAYVFTRNTGVWTLEQKLVGSGTNGRIATDQFGVSVSVYSDTVVVGSHGQDYDASGSNLLASAGAAYVFTRNTGVWTLQQKLVGSGTNGRLANDFLGYSVSVYDNSILAGSYGQNWDGNGWNWAAITGAAYAYGTRNGIFDGFQSADLDNCP